MTKVILVKNLKDDPAKKIQELSQCAYDILQIAKAIIEDPGEYKELQLVYCELYESLYSQMIAEGFKFVDDPYVLPLDLLYLPHREEEDKKVLYKAEKNLRKLVFEIEEKRKKMLGGRYRPHTGIRNVVLIRLLEEIKGKRKSQGILLAEENVSEDQEEDAAIKNVATLDDKSGITSRVENGERILTRGLHEISIGSVKNGPNKIWECLSPIGVEKTIMMVFSITTTENGKYAPNKRRMVNIEQIKEILRDRFKELQAFTIKLKVKIAIKFNDSRETVFLDVK